LAEKIQQVNFEEGQKLLDVLDKLIEQCK